MTEALRDKLKYLRNFGKKKVKKESDGDSPLPKKPKIDYKQFPVINHEPSIPAGEDSVSNGRNQKMLIMEEKKVNPNKKIISTLMERTYAFRRKDIMKTSRPLNEVLKLYPSLKRLDQVRIQLR